MPYLSVCHTQMSNCWFRSVSGQDQFLAAKLQSPPQHPRCPLPTLHRLWSLRGTPESATPAGTIFFLILGSPFTSLRLLPPPHPRDCWQRPEGWRRCCRWVELRQRWFPGRSRWLPPRRTPLLLAIGQGVRWCLVKAWKGVDWVLTSLNLNPVLKICFVSYLVNYV